jgi:hypothetical protein
MSSINNVPQSAIVDLSAVNAKTPSNKVGWPLTVWQLWFSQVFDIVFDVSNSGTSAQRPTQRLYPGKPYFDTDLGIPIWINGSGVWVNSAGAPV